MRAMNPGMITPIPGVYFTKNPTSQLSTNRLSAYQAVMDSPQFTPNG